MTRTVLAQKKPLTDADLQAALDDRELGIHPDSDTLLEIVDGPAYGAGGSITFGTAPPSGGVDGDIYLQYEE